MKIISWNVAGLRACVKKGFEDFFTKEDADIYCLQETKILKEQTPFHKEGYEEYLYPALKKGYSGTMVYTRIHPESVTYGIGEEEYDQEGRTITLEFKDFYVVNSYVPNSKRELLRLSSRMIFEEKIKAYLNLLKKKKDVIYCGDLNVAHEEIDIKNPKENRRSAGFTDEEREKMTELLQEGYIDTFRHFHKEEVKYTWWSYLGHARERNVGWRLDYFITNQEMLEKIVDSKILDDVEGSDHCPIELEIKS